MRAFLRAFWRGSMVERRDARGRPLLILMVREPRAGRVKTRLAADIGTASALRFYRAVTANMIRRLGKDPRWRLVLAVTPDHAVRSRAWPSAIPRIAQGRGDLGVRMERLLRMGGASPAAIIGSDIPCLCAAHIARTFSLLRTHDAVFGPAGDGGYWLAGVGAGRHAQGLFGNVRWSTPYALEDTLANLKGRKAGFAAQLDDVDGGPSFQACAWRGMRVTPVR